MPKRFAVIVAGGNGTRLGGELPKQFLPLGKIPMLAYALQSFHAVGAQIWLVLPQAHISTWQKMLQEQDITVPHKVVSGGSERFHSVKNALDNIGDEEGLVAIHDAARPFASPQLMESIFKQAHICGGVIPVLPVKESIRQEINENEFVSADRRKFYTVQTPQTFNLKLLKKAYLQPYNQLFTDDASVYESAGNKVQAIAGEELNFKITTQQDWEFAQYLVENKQLSPK